MMILTWLRSVKTSLTALAAGVLGFFVLWFRWSAVKFERRAREMQGRAEKAEEQAKGYEAAHVARSKADKAVEEARATRKPRAKRRTGLEGQE